MAFCDMATLVSFCSILEDRMANFGLIDFKLGLYIKVNVNAGKNKFEVQMPLWHKNIKLAQEHFSSNFDIIFF